MFRKRFKFNQSTIINILMIERYFISDVRNNRESVNYIQQMINHAKDVSFNNIFHQIIWIWRNLNPELKRNIFVFIEHTTLSQFLQLIENKKKMWQEVYKNCHLDQVNQSNQRDRNNRERDSRTDQYSAIHTSFQNVKNRNF